MYRSALVISSALFTAGYDLAGKADDGDTVKIYLIGSAANSNSYAAL